MEFKLCFANRLFTFLCMKMQSREYFLYIFVLLQIIVLLVSKIDSAVSGDVSCTYDRRRLQQQTLTSQGFSLPTQQQLQFQWGWLSIKTIVMQTNMMTDLQQSRPMFVQRQRRESTTMIYCSLTEGLRTFGLDFLKWWVATQNWFQQEWLWLGLAALMDIWKGFL